jgi:hypothetical protein
MDAIDGDRPAGRSNDPVSGLANKFKGGRPRQPALTDEDALRAAWPNAPRPVQKGVSLGDAFFDTVHHAARQSGCELLFEIPSVLFRDAGGRAAAMRCGTDGEAELFFILFDEVQGAVSIVEAAEVTEGIVDFIRSYAGVLSLIGKDRQLVAPLIQ